MLSEQDKRIIRELQEGLPLVERPYLAVADRIGMTEDDLIARVKELISSGVIRRFGAAVRHQDLGYSANAMIVWQVPEEMVQEKGAALASFTEVSHCYQRICPPGWNFNLYTVVHGQSKEECQATAKRLSAAVGVSDYRLIFSTRELKKSSMKYFLEKK